MLNNIDEKKKKKRHDWHLHSVLPVEQLLGICSSIGRHTRTEMRSQDPQRLGSKQEHLHCKGANWWSFADIFRILAIGVMKIEIRPGTCCGVWWVE
jgi:hypothetical protein